MSDMSRRTVLRGAGAAAAVAAAAVVVPGGATAMAAAQSGDGSVQGDAVTGEVVVYVRDASTGEITVMSGDREVVVTDRRLAQRLARLAD